MASGASSKSFSKSQRGGGKMSASLKDLRNRVLFVLGAIFVYRIGACIPIPGLDPVKLASIFSQHQSGLLGMFNMFSGGALSRMTVFAMGIMPYISASIIIQMYSQISPSLKRLRKEGEAGKHKINQYTRYSTVILAFLQACFMSRWLVGSGVVLHDNFSFYFISIITLVTGTILLMWIGEQMTERGIGNGISLLIFASIVSRFPEAIAQLFEQVKDGQMKPMLLIVLGVVVFFVTFVVVFMERAQRKITINYANRQHGARNAGPTANHLPLKINMAGVIPVIFAQSLILFPGTIATFLGKLSGFGWLNSVALSLQFGQPMYVLLFAFAVIFFSFFYTALVFNPKEISDNLKKSGAFIPGIRPGSKTSEYIDNIMTKLTLVGSFYLAAVALLPQFLILSWKVPFYFGGTSLLIVVVVVMDFMAQVQAHIMGHRYESLIKKSSRGKKKSVF